MNTCFVQVTTLSHMCVCLCMYQAGMGWGDSTQDQVRPWSPDFGHFIPHDSFTQPQMFQAGFCCVNTEQINRLAPVLHVESCVVLVTVVSAKIFFYIPCLLLRAVP